MKSSDEMKLVELLARKLSEELDSQNKNSVKPIGQLMLKMPVELMALFAKEVGLERVVKNNLDEENPFKKLFKIMNKYD